MVKRGGLEGNRRCYCNRRPSGRDNAVDMGRAPPLQVVQKT